MAKWGIFSIDWSNSVITGVEEVNLDYTLICAMGVGQVVGARSCPRKGGAVDRHRANGAWFYKSFLHYARMNSNWIALDLPLRHVTWP